LSPICVYLCGNAIGNAIGSDNDSNDNNNNTNDIESNYIHSKLFDNSNKDRYIDRGKDTSTRSISTIELSSGIYNPSNSISNINSISTNE
jgi:hypothetical protein